MKKGLWIGIAAGTAAVLGTAAAVLWYNVRPLPVFGKTYPANAEAIALDGDRIGSVDRLIGALAPFRRLTALDLGDFPVNVREEDKLLAAFPGVDLRYETVVDFYGGTVSCETEVLDLSDLELSDAAELRAALPYLKKLKTVYAAESALPREERDALERDYPGVTFLVTSVVDVCGRGVRDNVIRLDLSGAAAGEDLEEALKKLPDLREVYLYGSGVTTERQLAMVKDFPAVTFGWDVEIAGERVDSLVRDLDLSGKKGVTTARVRELRPLFPRLTRLDLSDCGIGNEEMASLREDLPGVKVVWRLYMGEWSLKTDAVAFSVLIYNYDHERLHSADIQVLRYCTDLQALDLGHQAITDISVIGDYLPFRT